MDPIPALPSISFADIEKRPYGTIYYDGNIGKVLCKIVKRTFALCAYIGIPKNTGIIIDASFISCHGGISYHTNKPEDTHIWYGWDYGHEGLGDITFDSPYKHIPIGKYPCLKAWTVQDVYKNMYSTVSELQKKYPVLYDKK